MIETRSYECGHEMSSYKGEREGHRLVRYSKACAMCEFGVYPATVEALQQLAVEAGAQAMLYNLVPPLCALETEGETEDRIALAYLSRIRELDFLREVRERLAKEQDFMAVAYAAGLPMIDYEAVFIFLDRLHSLILERTKVDFWAASGRPAYYSLWSWLLTLAEDTVPRWVTPTSYIGLLEIAKEVQGCLLGSNGPRLHRPRTLSGREAQAFQATMRG